MLKKLFITSALGFFALSNTHAAELPKQSYLPLEIAQKAANAALEACKKDGYRVSVAIVDQHGNLLTLLRHPQAGPHTVRSSLGKAFTSASLREPTSSLTKMISEKPFLEGLRDMDERLVILDGGFPITINGEHLGGIGVGGAPGGHLDENCANEGLKTMGSE